MINRMTNIDLTTTNVVKTINQHTCDIVYRKLIRKFTLESIGSYYEKDYIISKLNEIIKIEIDDTLDSSSEVAFKNGILKLPSCFFCSNIESSSDAVDLIVRYPYLKDLLTMYGVFIVGFDTKDNEEDKIIKNAIANYFAISNNGNNITNKKVAEMNINSYATNNILFDNIIRQLSLIFGEEILSYTLTKGTNYLIEQIGANTKKKGLGKKIVACIIELSKISNIEKQGLNELYMLGNIIDEKLFPMYETIRNYDFKYQNSLLNILSMHDYDFKIFSLIEPSIDLSNIDSLTEEEKRIISHYIHMFDENWKKFVFLVRDYPHVKPIGEKDDGTKIYDGESFSFLNKFLSIEEECFNEYLHTCEEVQYLWQNIQESIIYELLPRYIRCNKNAYIDLDEILSLSKYEADNKKFDLSNKFKTRRLAKKLGN